MIDLKLQELTFEYDGRQLFDKLNFQLEPGTFGLLTGPSGCGKSTLLKLLAGLLPQYGGTITSGQATLNGLPVGEIVPFQRAKKVAMLFQHPSRQFAMKTVQEQVSFALANLQLAPPVLKKRVRQTLDWLGIARFANRQVHTLSGGEQQRAALACVLAMDSDVILLDEPFANVDTAGRQQLLADLQRLQSERGKTILLADHDLNGYRGVADRWYQLSTQHQLSTKSVDELPVSTPVVAVKHQRLQAARLAARHLRVAVGQRLLIDDGQLAIPQGQLGLLSGDNGAGKSTLFATLSRQHDYGGQLLFDQQPATRLALKKWALTVGWVFQNSADQFIAIKAADELAASRTHSCRPQYWTSQRCTQAVRRLGITDCLDRVSYQLSGGQQKKLQILSMVVMAQPVMLLDEPFAGLDSQSLRAVMQLLKQVATDLQVGMLIISHQREGVVDWLDYEIRLANHHLTLLEGDDYHA
ncbi:ABC transporter ATP-binding protein [uncultured Limosilactobacillus sp.]|uniref:ATP-binding cassette domain-containing protein n=1 Tax=uncultured Limosilactobacillus sp. TaxID=2837629 RepID=UPI0025E1C97D|nr:ABC transporter ATP-binding protein [uncultured Limosilactobacillus sp.]